MLVSEKLSILFEKGTFAYNHIHNNLMNETKSVLDHESIEAFFKEVMSPLLPNARHKMASYLGPVGVVRASHISLDLADSNEINYQSDYFYTKKFSFIHYTSITALINILKEKKIRLYNLNGMNDREEFVTSFRHSGNKKNQYEIDEIKSKIFCFSMCEIDLEENKLSLPQWRSYGQDGKGVGLVLSFNKSFAKEWVFFMLSNVFYDEKRMVKYREIESLYKSFKQKHNLHINNFDQLFYKYYSFHKNKIYSFEKEVRLIYCQGFNLYDEAPIKYDITKDKKQTTYIELDLEWEWDSKTKEFIMKQGVKPYNVHPKVSIDKIILGYRLDNESKHNLAQVIYSLSKNYKKAPKIIDSSLAEHFKEKWDAD